MTFSLAGRCEQTGRTGGIVCSSSIAVSARCLWCNPAGVVLSQNVTDPHLGMVGLQLLAEGCNARNVLERMVAAKPHAEWRQLAVIDGEGDSSVYTGQRGLGVTGAAQGSNCVAAGNLLRGQDVPKAMVRAFEASATQPFAERLLLALKAGAAAGGEAGPVHSAGLQVCDGSLPWPIADLRIDWSDDPITELCALWEHYAPQMDDYLLRAQHPEKAPSYGVPGDL